MALLNQPLLSYPPTLVVDSNGVAAKQLAQQLTHSGFLADVATSCQSALEMDSLLIAAFSVTELAVRQTAYAHGSRLP
jgi:hypothetical protein